ncbi:ECF RNA polymerase sigma factor RpoE [Flavimaricola marinus]|uniref:ECF RNA polymerase sigma factor RpoE n=2 Tax=Flavimaricola marinus TaxID=1819565 RepID=A0A238LJ65_9RHOB|nr:ECF RNA polymerase sigma factor RpoE [Flavimaricola marinus]
MFSEPQTFPAARMPVIYAPPGDMNERNPSRREKVAVNVNDDSKRAEWSEEIAAIRDHKDQRAFARLFEHFAPRLKSFLMKSGSTAEFAEECTQEVMATLWRKAHMFDGSKASVSTWIYTIARNRKIDMIRKQRRPEPEDLPWGPENEPDQDDVIVLAEETEQLGRALAALPEKQRKLIERAYFGELSHSEIAEETGLPLGTIKSRIRLALERLRHSMT